MERGQCLGIPVDSREQSARSKRRGEQDSYLGPERRRFLGMMGHPTPQRLSYRDGVPLHNVLERSNLST